MSRSRWADSIPSPTISRQDSSSGTVWRWRGSRLAPTQPRKRMHWREAMATDWRRASTPTEVLQGIANRRVVVKRERGGGGVKWLARVNEIAK
jgi:hypothetical protein